MNARASILRAVVLLAACASACAAARGSGDDGFFQRYSAPDPQRLEADIASTRDELAAARARDDVNATLQLSADLGEMLTTSRREQEARTLLMAALEQARRLDYPETTGWLLLQLATANQYLHRRSEAAAQFAEALRIAREQDALELEHYTLQHWGRFLAEAGDIERARDCFTQALALRIRLDDGPRQASSRRALEALDALR